MVLGRRRPKAARGIKSTELQDKTFGGIWVFLGRFQTSFFSNDLLNCTVPPLRVESSVLKLRHGCRGGASAAVFELGLGRWLCGSGWQGGWDHGGDPNKASSRRGITCFEVMWYIYRPEKGSSTHGYTWFVLGVSRFYDR